MSVKPPSTAGKPENCKQRGGGGRTTLLTHFIYLSGGFSFKTKTSGGGQP